MPDFNVRFEIVECTSCHIPFCITETYARSLRECGNTFFCPAGHHLHWPKAEPSRADLEAQLAQARANLAAKQRSLEFTDAAYRETHTKLRKAQREVRQLKKPAVTPKRLTAPRAESS